MLYENNFITLIDSLDELVIYVSTPFHKDGSIAQVVVYYKLDT
jgi:hypothetical protein